MQPGYETLSDERLIDACNAGDARAFEALYRRYRDWAVAVAYRFTGDRDESLDVMQEAFVYLLGRFPGFVLSGRVASYLYVVIKHAALAGKRKQRRQRVGAEAPEVGAAAEDGGAGERTRALEAAIEHLPDAQREVVLMRVVDGMSMEEIGMALSIPVGTVKSRLHHALGALRGDPRTAAYFGTCEEERGTV